jgi:hypothetical protein
VLQLKSGPVVRVEGIKPEIFRDPELVLIDPLFPTLVLLGGFLGEQFDHYVGSLAFFPYDPTLALPPGNLKRHQHVRPAEILIAHLLQAEVDEHITADVAAFGLPVDPGFQGIDQQVHLEFVAFGFHRHSIIAGQFFLGGRYEDAGSNRFDQGGFWHGFNLME